MLYIQLSQNYREYDKLRIKEIHFYDTIDDNEPPRLSFSYQVYKKLGSNYVELFSKNISISNAQAMSNLISFIPEEGKTAWNSICSALLNYLINNSIEVGTIELE